MRVLNPHSQRFCLNLQRGLTNIYILGEKISNGATGDVHVRKMATHSGEPPHKTMPHQSACLGRSGD